MERSSPQRSTTNCYISNIVCIYGREVKIVAREGPPPLLSMLPADKDKRFWNRLPALWIYFSQIWRAYRKYGYNRRWRRLASETSGSRRHASRKWIIEVAQNKLEISTKRTENSRKSVPRTPKLAQTLISGAIGTTARCSLCIWQKSG